jgi:hypothetical protein
MTAASLVCWNCGASLDEVPTPLSRYAECLSCRTELHVCRMCRFYDVTVAQSCKEPMAEEVKDKARANFCELFQPRADAYQPDTPTGDASSEATLAALFGGPPEAPSADHPGDESRQALDDLFGSDPSTRDD